jgi:hypothetical protein
MHSFKRWGWVALVLLAGWIAAGLWPLNASGIVTAAYNLIQQAGSPLTARTTINCSTGMTCSDDSVNKVTVMTATGTGGSVTQVNTGCGASGGPITSTGTITGTGVCVTIANASSTGTTVNTLTKLTGAPSTAVISGAGDTAGAIGIVDSGAGTTGSAVIQENGQHACVFDGATTAGHYVQISATTAGNCHDTGSATYPTTGQVIGTVLSTNGGAGTYTVDMSLKQANVTPAAGATLSVSGPCLTDGTNFYLPPLNRIITAASNTTFSWVNQNTATIATSGCAVQMTATSNAGGSVQLRCSSPPMTTSFTLTAAFISNVQPITLGSNTNNESMVAFRESTTAKLVTYGLTSANNSNPPWNHQQWTNPTTFSSQASDNIPFSPNSSTSQTLWPYFWAPIWVKLQYDGTNLLYSYSYDGGVTFAQLRSEAKATFFTTAPDQVCWGTNPQGGAANPLMIDWLVTSP